MNFNNLKRILKRGTSIGLSSFIMLVTIGTPVFASDLDIETVNIANMSSIKQNRMTLTGDIEKDENGVDITNCSFNLFGSQFEDVYLEPSPIILSSSDVPDGEGVCNSLNKTYMSYTAVTSKNSGQYKLLNSELAYTDEVTGLRMYEGRYCIAVGTFYASIIGTKLNLIMENGSVVECILGDVKSDAHTDPTHRYQAVDGSVVEMIVDKQFFYSTSQYPEELRGRVLRIEVVE